MLLLDEEADDDKVGCRSDNMAQNHHVKIPPFTTLSNLTGTRKELVTGSQRLCIGSP